jgi:hypothetical protein
MVQSHINYGITIWGNAKLKYFSKLEIVHRKLVRTIYNLVYRDSVDNVMNYIAALTPKELYLKSLICLIDKIRRYGLSIFNCTVSCDIHCHATRHSNNLFLTRRHGNVGVGSVSYKAINEYNRIPYDIRNLHNVVLFSKMVKRYIIAQRSLFG